MKVQFRLWHLFGLAFAVALGLRSWQQEQRLNEYLQELRMLEEDRRSELQAQAVGMLGAKRHLVEYTSSGIAVTLRTGGLRDWPLAVDRMADLTELNFEGDLRNEFAVGQPNRKRLLDLAERSGLWVFGIQEADLREADLSFLQEVEMRSLRSLKLRDTQLGPAQLAVVAKLTGLEELDLTGSNVTDNDLSALTTLTQLKTLQLEKCPLTDAAVPALENFRALTTLNVRETGLSRTKLDELSKKLNRTILHSQP